MNTLCPECCGEKTIGYVRTDNGIDDKLCRRCSGTGVVAGLTPDEKRQLERRGIVISTTGEQRSLRSMSYKELYDLSDKLAIKLVKAWIKAVDGLTVAPYVYGQHEGIAATVNGRLETWPWGVIPEDSNEPLFRLIRHEIYRRAYLTVAVRLNPPYSRSLKLEAAKRNGNLARFDNTHCGSFYAVRRNFFYWQPIQRMPDTGYGI